MTINEVMRWPEKLPADKRMHMIIGSVTMAILLSVFGWGRLAIVGSALTTVVVAWGIEVYQLSTKSGTYDNWDAIAVIAGGSLVLLPYLIR